MTTGKGNKTCKKCGQVILEKITSSTPIGLSNEQEDAIVKSLTKKAIKATMAKLKPFLDKLEEAAKQQAQEHANMNTNDAPLSYQEQVQNIQDATKKKIQIQELKINKRLQSLQSKIAKRG